MLEHITILRYKGRELGCEMYRVKLTMFIGDIYAEMSEGQIELFREKGIEVRNVDLLKN